MTSNEKNVVYENKWRLNRGVARWHSGKESTCQSRGCKTWGLAGSGRSSGRGNGNLLQYSCLKNEQRSLTGYSLWCCKESDMTEQTHTQGLDRHVLFIGGGGTLNANVTLTFSSVQSLSRIGLFAIPWIAALQASLSINKSRSSPRLTCIMSVMPSSHLILCCPLLLLPPLPPSIRVFSHESTLRMRWPKYWSFSCSITPSKEIPGLISFKID